MRRIGKKGTRLKHAAYYYLLTKDPSFVLDNHQRLVEFAEDLVGQTGSRPRNGAARAPNQAAPTSSIPTSASIPCTSKLTPGAGTQGYGHGLGPARLPRTRPKGSARPRSGCIRPFGGPWIFPKWSWNTAPCSSP